MKRRKFSETLMVVRTSVEVKGPKDFYRDCKRLAAARAAEMAAVSSATPPSEAQLAREEPHPTDPRLVDLVWLYWGTPRGS